MSSWERGMIKRVAGHLASSKVLFGAQHGLFLWNSLYLKPQVLWLLPLWFSPWSYWWGSEWVAAWGLVVSWGKTVTSCENQSCSCLSFPTLCVLWKRQEQARERRNKLREHRSLDSASGSRGHLWISPVLISDRSSIPSQTDICRM